MRLKVQRLSLRSVSRTGKVDKLSCREDPALPGLFFLGYDFLERDFYLGFKYAWFGFPTVGFSGVRVRVARTDTIESRTRIDRYWFCLSLSG